MKRPAGRPALLLLILLLLPASAVGFWKFPPPLPPEEFGNILINRTSEANKVKPVAFSHWIHRKTHACRVCHFELEFNLKAGTTEITEEANRSGRFCGACHDGKKLFGHAKKEDCGRCHTGDIRTGSDRFSENSKFPTAPFGNGIDWTAAVEEKWIAPIRHLSIPDTSDMAGAKELALESEWLGTPPAIFSHQSHSTWDDCNDCHPSIFTLKKKATIHFDMTRNIEGEFCGVCHMTVAFPMTDCKRCHPRMRVTPNYPKPMPR